MKPTLPKFLLTSLLAAQTLTAATPSDVTVWNDKTMGLVHDTDIDERLRGNLLLNTTLR